MATSSQLTAKIKSKANPAEAEFKIWMATRYLVAQNPATSDYDGTDSGFYKGCAVIPGPKCNPRIAGKLETEGLTLQDFQIVKERHYIRFTDNITTDDADANVGRALFRPMTSSEADEFEKIVKRKYAIDQKTEGILS